VLEFLDFMESSGKYYPESVNVFTDKA
jgi:hypothetical protein